MNKDESSGYILFKDTDLGYNDGKLLYCYTTLNNA